MAEQRTVTIHINAVQQQTMQHNTNHDEWFRAIGRLSVWNMTYPTVNIYPDDKTDMVAVYLTEQGERGYVIGAVWNDTTNTYGFHS